MPWHSKSWGARTSPVRPCPIAGSFCFPSHPPASQKGHLPDPGPLTWWQWPHLRPHPYPEAAVSRCEHLSQHLLSASFLAPLSASPLRWPQPPWPRQQVKECGGQLALLDGGMPRARLRPASGLPGHPSGPRTGNRLALHRPVQALVGLLSGIWVLGVPKNQSETRTGESSSAPSSSNQAGVAPIPQLLTLHPLYLPRTNPPGETPKAERHV